MKKVAGILDHKISLDGYEHRTRIQSKIVAVENLKDDIIQYTFKFIKPNHVNYVPGQFILVKIQDNPEMFRAYSIAAFNEKEGTLSIGIKKMKDGYGTSIIFDTFKKGQEVDLEGPMGEELIVDKKAKKVLLVAGGIGITPFAPIVTDLIKDDTIEDVTLVYGANYEKEFIYKEEFNQLAKENNRFNFVQVAAFDDEWKGEKGFVTDYIKKTRFKRL